MRTVFSGSLLFGSSVLASACGAIGLGEVATELASGRFAVTVAIDHSSLAMLDAVPLDEPSLGGRRPGRQLAYLLESYSGAVLATGEVADPRRARAEWLEAMALRSAPVEAGVGVLELELPGIPGVLTVYEGAGAQRREVGRLAYEPSRIGGRIAQPLAASTDVLGPAFQLAGQAAPAFAVDMLFLPDGYREDELEGFYDDASSVFAKILEQPDLAAHADAFNAWAQPIRSRDSGIDIPSEQVFRDTAFDTSFEVYVDRCVYPKTSEAVALIESLGEAAQADVVIVIVNSERYGGCAGQKFTTQTRHPLAPLVGAHELGHSLLGLHDEYSSGMCQAEARGPNISPSAELAALPWVELVTTTSLPTPDEPAYADAIGAFEGASYCEAGMYRPQHTCLMREVTAPMCAVCRRELDRYMAALSSLPMDPEVGGPDSGEAEDHDYDFDYGGP